MPAVWETLVPTHPSPSRGLREGLFKARFQTASLGVSLAGSGPGRATIQPLIPALSFPRRDRLRVPEPAGAVKQGSEDSSNFSRGLEKQASVAWSTNLGHARPPLGAPPRLHPIPRPPLLPSGVGGRAPGRGITDQTLSRSSTLASW